ncbi:MAG: GNAT family N-acetyltransferase [Halobacteriales archaeon]
MEFREAVTDDASAIREVAHASLHASYEDVLGEETIHEALDRWYDVDELVEDVDGEDLVFVVAIEDGDVVGFAQSYVRGHEGRILWLHVHPDHRDGGIGSRLLDRTRDHLAGLGVEQVTGVVLAANDAGNDFYEDNEFSLEDQRTVEIGDGFYAENVYVDVAGIERELEAIETEEGHMFVDRSSPDRGRDGPFYPVYRTEAGTRLWGYRCGNCGSIDTSMDTMERVVCNDCDNVRKAARWDAAYL